MGEQGNPRKAELFVSDNRCQSRRRIAMRNKNESTVAN